MQRLSQERASRGDVRTGDLGERAFTGIEGDGAWKGSL